MEVATLFGCAVTTGFGVVENNARLKMGESVVVFGAGGIGLSIVQAASLVSAHPIIAVDQFENRLQFAIEMGATHIVNTNNVAPQKDIHKILGSVGTDSFIDNTGQPSVIELGYRLTKPHGRVTLVGVPQKGNNISIHSLPLHFGKTLSGSHGGDCRPHIDIPRYNNLYHAGKIKLRELITDIFNLDQINEAIYGVRNGTIKGRCLISME